MRRELRILILAFVLVVGPAVILTGLAGRVISHWRVILETQMGRSVARVLEQTSVSLATDVVAGCDGLSTSIVQGWPGAGRWNTVVSASAGFRSAHPWCQGVFLVGADGAILYPSPALAAPAAAGGDLPGRPLYRVSAAAEALSLQYAHTNDAGAVNAYAKAVEQPGLDAVAAAQLRLRSASGLRRLGRIRDAERELRQVTSAGLAGGGPLCDTEEGFHLDLVAQQTLVNLLDEAGETARALDEALSLAEGVSARYARLPGAQRAALAAFLNHRVPLLLRAVPSASSERRWALSAGPLAEWGRAGVPDEARLPALAAGLAVWRAAGSGAGWRWISPSLDQAFLMTPGPEDTVLAVAVDPAGLQAALRAAALRAAPASVAFELGSPFATNGPARLTRLTLGEVRLASPLASFVLIARPADEAAFDAGARLQTRLYAWGAGVLALAIMIGGTLLWRISVSEIRRARTRIEFAAAVSHDLRTPLASMRMLAESLYLGRITDEAKRQRFLATLITECDRLGRLTDRALYFIRFGQDALQYRLTEGDLGVLIRETTETYVMSGMKRARHLRVQVSDGLPAVRFDGGAMEQVVLNLLDNADKYSAEGQDIRVAVDASADRRNVIVSIQDRGIGIAPADVRRIFRAYYRGERARSSDVSGVGLGLALCRHIVRAHDGRIEVESTVGEGSTFRVVLPAV
jgi:signal transduction histidine kinase